MMEHNTEKLLSAIGDVDAVYLEEALDFDAANAGRKRARSCSLYFRFRCWSWARMT